MCCFYVENLFLTVDISESFWIKIWHLGLVSEKVDSCGVFFGEGGEVLEVVHEGVRAPSEDVFNLVQCKTHGVQEDGRSNSNGVTGVFGEVFFVDDVVNDNLALPHNFL